MQLLDKLYEVGTVADIKFDPPTSVPYASQEAISAPQIKRGWNMLKSVTDLNIFQPHLTRRAEIAPREA